MKAIFIFIVFPLLVYGQIGINTTNPTKTLDINGDLRVRTLGPGSAIDGVLSTDEDGNIHKIPRSEFDEGATGFSSSILGYEPQLWAARPTPPGPVPGGGTANELGCKKWASNGHTYCAYQLSQVITWFNAFLFAKSMGGYLVTMPNDAERIWVNQNIVASGTGYNLVNNIWIGFNKIRRPGNPDQLQWITGEEWKINWSTNPATTEQWFTPGEPNNSGGNEGATHIWASSNVERKWNDRDGNATASQNQLIVEFNE
ncbi:lectin-like protein [Chryseobacterium sp. ISL-6]|uniref:lectin-like protein n=1 Tax=Chryseobacterium sp. ISL-6 TaxID=2819143 RepID=UPI001BE5E35D|nr:lectin-like protein [Chryseobacterium sp. ISL-6]MBT2623738.1 hypothetical protein [Chryseobacterium sp. ISL-6]